MIMRLLITAVACLLVGFVAGFLVRPGFGEAERAFYKEVVYYHAKVTADGHYGASASTHLAWMDLDKLIQNMAESDFKDRSKHLAAAFSEAHEVKAASEFKAQAENFFLTYGPRMP